MRISPVDSCGSPFPAGCGFRRRPALLIALALALLFAPALHAFEALARRTLVVANENSADSVALAEYYIEKRGIPPENLYLVRAPRSETIDWAQFVESIYNPLRRQLIEDRWLQGTLSDRTDRDGRLLHSTSGHRIEYLVLCHGMPLRIRHDDELLPEAAREQLPEALRTNRGALDSQLALLSHSTYAINAYLRNPLHENRFPSPGERAAVIRVSRLDGPTVEDAKNLVDMALYGEEHGLQGRAYIDLGGPSPSGDEWLERASRRIGELGFDLTVSGAGENLPAAVRFDTPALYFGWYSPHVEGPFKLNGFRFAPGAVAIHIHSFSATTVRADDSRWVGPFVATGVAGTVGNVYEPYLELTHRPDLMLEALSRGNTLGEAAFYSLPALSWQGILVGDPLYRPFRVGLDRQLAAGEVGTDGSLLQYAVIRKMNLLRKEGEIEGAIRLGEEFHEADLRVALAFALGRFYAEAGDTGKAREILRFVAELNPVSDIQAGVVMEIIDFLVENGGAGTALDASRVLIERSELSPPVRAAAIRQGARLARQRNESRLARQWESELARLKR